MKKMEIAIHSWWNAKIYNNNSILNPEKTLQQFGNIIICTIIINKKVVGCVKWDGNNLTISKKLVDTKSKPLIENEKKYNGEK